MILLLKKGQGFLHNDRCNVIMGKLTLLALFLIHEGGCCNLRQIHKRQVVPLNWGGKTFGSGCGGLKPVLLGTLPML